MTLLAVSANTHGTPPDANPRYRLWSILRATDHPCRMADLYHAANIEPGLFFSLIDNWSDRSFLIIHNSPLRIAMTQSARRMPRPPRTLACRKKCTVPKKSGRQRLWAAMRVLKEFDLPTLCMAAEAQEKGAHEFLAALLRVDYITSTPASGDNRAQFRLVRNTGPLHPVIRRRKEGYISVIELDDRNDGRSYRDEIDMTPRIHRRSQKAAQKGGV